MRIGEKYTFKRFAKVRGRRPVGEVVRKAGALTYMKKSDGTVVPVQTRFIENYYVFIAYKKRKAA